MILENKVSYTCTETLFVSYPANIIVQVMIKKSTPARSQLERECHRDPSLVPNILVCNYFLYWIFLIETVYLTTSMQMTLSSSLNLPSMRKILPFQKRLKNYTDIFNEVNRETSVVFFEEDLTFPSRNRLIFSMIKTYPQILARSL